MGRDPYLVAYRVTYYSRGAMHSELVWAQNDLRDPRDDEYDNEHGEHYRLWRFMPDGRRITSFRCRYDEWVSTAAIVNVPPTAEELQELEQLRPLRERVEMSDMRAAHLEHRLMESQREAANLRDQLATAQRALADAQAEIKQLTAPRAEDLPF